MNANLPRPMTMLGSFSLLVAATVLFTGCKVSHSENGDSDNVQVRTPFGDMHIKTNDDANVAAIGLNTYPGAVPVKEHDDKDNDNANISLNFGDFHLGVKAASYQTTDSPDKVEAFYRKDLTRYGDVIQCRGSEPVGQHTHTSQGLTCSDDEGGTHIHTTDGHTHGFSFTTGDSSKELELRAGSPGHLHIVSIDPKNGGTKFGLVALDLPNHHDSSDSE